MDLKTFIRLLLIVAFNGEHSSEI